MLLASMPRLGAITGGRANACTSCRQNRVRSFFSRNASASAAVKPKRKVPGLLKICVMSTVPITTFMLGTWQVRRHKWKENLIAKKKAEDKLPPSEIPQDLTELEDMEWKKMYLRGHFDHSREQYVGPRPLIKPAGSTNRQTYSGFLVITPFQLAESGKWILVNRGWVQREHKYPDKRLAGQVEGDVELVALVRRGEKTSDKVVSQVRPKTWRAKNPEKLAELCGTEPYLFDAVYESSVPGGPIGGQTADHLRNKHMEYIVTWYGISLVTGILVIMLLQKHLRIRKRQHLYNMRLQREEEQKRLTVNTTKDLPAGVKPGERETPV